MQIFYIQYNGFLSFCNLILSCPASPSGNWNIQKFSHPFFQQPLCHFQMLLQKVHYRMASKPETYHAPKLLLLLRPHDLCADFFIWNIIEIRTCLCIFLQILIILFLRTTKQRQTIIEYRGRRDYISTVIIPQDSTIFPIGIYAVSISVNSAHLDAVIPFQFSNA